MAQYAELQIREIRRYSRMCHLSENEGCLRWVNRGLAKRFAIKHREEFGLIKEAA